MHEIAVLETLNTARLSVRRTFIPVPSRDFTASWEPSTASMVPRIRTVGDCCAHAGPSTDIAMSEAVSTRDINDEIFGMAASSLGFSPPKGENNTARQLFHGPLRAEWHRHIG